MYKTKSVTIQGLLLNSYMAVAVGFCSTPADYVRPRKESKVALEHVPARTPCTVFWRQGEIGAKNTRRQRSHD